jgi:hypothetical protein
MLDLGPRGRTLVLAVFFGGEALLIATAPLRTDRSYGFRMFPEASSITLHVQRRLGSGELVDLTDGRWTAKDCQGSEHPFVWSKMVLSPAPARFDRSVSAPYGTENEVQRAADALRWVSDHTPTDCETRAFVVRVEQRKNGRPLSDVSFEVAREH